MENWLLFGAGLLVNMGINYVWHIRKTDKNTYQIETMSKQIQTLENQEMNTRVTKLEVEFQSVKTILLEIREDIREIKHRNENSKNNS